MRKKLFFRTIVLFAVITAATLVMGQACSKMTSVNARKPAVSESVTPGDPNNTVNSENNGNGGGYGGMVSIAVGPYGHGLRLPLASGDGYPAFQIVGQQSVCILDVFLGLIAPMVKDRIYRDANGVYSQFSFCGGAVKVNPETLNFTDYDQDIVIHQSKMHLYYDKSPAATGDVRRAAVHCQSPDGPASLTQTGTDATIYTEGGRYKAIIHRGVKESMGYIKYQIGPMDVHKSKTYSGYNFYAEDFSLKFKATPNAKGLGDAALEIGLETGTVRRTANCWSEASEL